MKSQLFNKCSEIVLDIAERYKSLFWITEDTHKKILNFIEEPLDTDPATLVGYKRKEYKRYQKFLTKKHKPSKPLVTPLIPSIFLPKSSTFNYQEIIDYFKGLYDSENN